MIVVYALFLQRATAEHTGENGAQLPVGVEREACSDLAAAARKQLCSFKSRAEPSRKPATLNGTIGTT